jgi:hypothetical protein
MGETMDERRERVEQAIANEELEGLTVSAESRRIADRYIVGEISAEQMADMIFKRYGITVPTR